MPQEKAVLPRKFFICEKLDEVPNPGDNEYPDKEYKEVKPKNANLVSSKLEYLQGDLHAPALDVDFPVECYESSTPGHYHILIDVPMPWRQYKKLLRTMYKCGIIEKGFYKLSVKRKASYLRKKGVLKKKPPQQQAPPNPAPQGWMNWH